jgi:hypothetical protein
LDGRLDESLAVLQTAIKRESGNTSEHYRAWHELQHEQGLTFMAKGDTTAAGTCLTSSAKLSKSSVFSPRIDLAIQLAKRGQQTVVKSYIAMITTWNSNISEPSLSKAIKP